ncbi:hypothetical protein [Psychrobacter sp. UBA3480]|uniref:hypothetical protein n=1 Tax=Psychrobacter sp. UBA3480 TaxID=1947350 RepID=UPI0025EB8D7E|nr:hypothetical protein [Psychrobacter sp. UBA3480]
MQIITIGKIQKQTLALYPQAVSLYKIYNKLIYPHLNKYQLKFEERSALSRPLVCVKDGSTLFLVNSFSLFNILKSVNKVNEALDQEVLLVEINADLFRFDLAFYELINMVSRYHSTIKLESIYLALSELLDTKISQRLFVKNNFSIVLFCNLINLPERTYHNRTKMQ